jgi:hypothetical protein
MSDTYLEKFPTPVRDDNPTAILCLTGTHICLLPESHMQIRLALFLRFPLIPTLWHLASRIQLFDEAVISAHLVLNRLRATRSSNFTVELSKECSVPPHGYFACQKISKLKSGVFIKFEGLVQPTQMTTSLIPGFHHEE